MSSVHTLFGLDDMMARYASDEDLAEIIRHKFTEPKKTLKELFSRMAFNILSVTQTIMRVTMPHSGMLQR